MKREAIMTRKFLGTLVPAVVIAAAVGAMLPGGVSAADAEAGEKVFRKCKACHVVDKEQNRVGPHLVGIVGRQSASVDGFKYSDAMKSADIVWTEENIDAYLEKPKDFIKGNRMAFAGLRKEEDRADVIEYLKSASQQSIGISPELMPALAGPRDDVRPAPGAMPFRSRPSPVSGGGCR
eukprot:TRINITY_DN10082_c0_g1_i2.p1 TRINITY_DN10082_c0_g1~~TRINITY_DN10082_c0_g1_i2.p1  ORF type:complete len:179 (+),score=29.23 TRINITY_DN10082_c0_g1_i2:506-1042(+)